MYAVRPGSTGGTVPSRRLTGQWSATAGRERPADMPDHRVFRQAR